MGITVITGDTLGECAVIFRIELVKTLYDELSVFLVLSEDDRLSEPVTAVDFDTTLHQVLQDGIYRCFVKHELVERSRGDKVGNIAVLSKIVLIAFLILIGEIVIGDTFLKELCLDLIVIVRHKHMICIDRRFVIVGIGRHTVLDLKEIIGVAVNIGFRCCCQTDHYRIEILKDRTIFLENASVALVSDDKVKVCRREQRYAVPCFCAVDRIQYRRICREHDTGISIVLITAKVAQRHIGQIVLEIILRLLDKCCSVSKEQDICDISAAAQNIGQA